METMKLQGVKVGSVNVIPSDVEWNMNKTQISNTFSSIIFKYVYRDCRLYKQHPYKLKHLITRVFGICCIG